mgnify:CR=1 FL=1
MANRSLNKVILIGNLTRDPELRYTPKGTAVCNVGLATNRSWTTDQGERKESVEFHRIVAWDKLAEVCSQLLFKGRRVYVEGRLQTRQWEGQDGNSRQTTEVVINNMIILDSRRTSQEGEEIAETVVKKTAVKPKEKTTIKKEKAKKENNQLEKEEVKVEDIPF